MTPHKSVTGTALLAVAFCAAVTLGIRAQSQNEEKDPLTFDVASVKLSAGCPPACGLIRQMPGGQTYHGEGVPLRVLMTVAYTVTDRQISGGPSWMNTDRFDIEAKAARPRTSDELHVMLRQLLEERFQLKVRRETREESVWALVVDKGGSKMPVHDPADLDHPPMGLQAVRGSDGSMCGGLAGHNVTMDYFAFTLSRSTDRIVIDRTGLPARYDVNLQFLPDAARTAAPDGGGGPAISPDCADLPSALPKQLGLRLESAKGPVEFLVVEHAEKPSGN
ncbi:MAG: TIGR03435 family protein [Bryobacteraceae bacterium]